MTAVQSLCPRAILMSNGTIEFDGLTEATVRRYLVEAGSSPSMIQWDELDEAPGAEYMRLQSIKAISLRSDNEDASLFDLKTPINIQINYRVYNEADFHITLHFITETGEVAFTSGGCCVEVDQDMPQSGDYELTCHVPENLLNEGKYFIKIMLIENKSRCVYQCDNIISFDVNDLSPRPIGSWHKREPGHVKPLLNWDLIKLSSNV
jgi:lipopolysaccharide transport system ATP-binding protein